MKDPAPKREEDLLSKCNLISDQVRRRKEL